MDIDGIKLLKITHHRAGRAPAITAAMRHKKEIMARKRMTPTKFEIDSLRELAQRNDCDMEMLIDALMCNVVTEQISIQIHYKKTGELPK